MARMLTEFRLHSPPAGPGSEAAPALRTPFALPLLRRRGRFISRCGVQTAGGRDQPVPPAACAQPVDWYPWGDEAFDRARSEDKPVLLSVGYSRATGVT